MVNSQDGCMKAISKGVVPNQWGTWWLGVDGCVHPGKEPAFTPLLRQFRQLGQWALQFDAMPTSEIAVLIDEESMLYGSIQNNLYSS